MASARTKVAIGGFTIGGVVLFVLALLYLSSESFFEKKSEYVLFFDGSISGLNVGAPVVFRGVPLGNVTRISLAFDRAASAIRIPVFVQLNESSIVRLSGEEIPESIRGKIIRGMIKRGLSARLQIQSLVTGQYRIELDYYKNVTPIFRMPDATNEIPTVPSPIAALQKSLDEVPLRDITHSVFNILKSISNAIGDGNELKASIAAFHAAFGAMNKTFAALHETLEKSQLRTSLNTSMQNLEVFSATLSRDLPKLLDALTTTSANLSQASERFKRVATSADNLVAPTGPAVQDFRRLLKEATDAARSLHNLADMLNRNPEALLKGKQGHR